MSVLSTSKKAAAPASCGMSGSGWVIFFAPADSKEPCTESTPEW